MGKNKNKKHKSISSMPSSIDMHVHTIRSLDGTYSTQQILNLALESNTKFLAITDHNSIESVKKAQRIIKMEPEKYGSINLIPGVEISCEDELLGAKFHLLVYDFDVNNKALNELLEKITKAEQKEQLVWFEFLEKNWGIKFTPYEIQKALSIYSEISLEAIAEMALLHIDENGKPAPYAKTKEDFIKAILTSKSTYKNLNKNKALLHKLLLNEFSYESMEQFEMKRPSLKEVLPIIKESGGVPVLAHPFHNTYFTLKKTSNNTMHKEYLKNSNKNLHKFLTRFKSITKQHGLEAGMEVLCPSQSGKEAFYLNLAKEHNLIVSGGSDFHGPHKSLFSHIGSVSSKYFIQRLPIIDYLKNNRNKDTVSYPPSIKGLVNYIPTIIADKYKSNNNSIQDKVHYKRASQVKKVVDALGTQPLFACKMNIRIDNIKARQNVLETLTTIKKWVKEDKNIIQKLKQNVVSYESAITLLEKHNQNYPDLFNIVEKTYEEIDKNDSLENKEKFLNFANIEKTVLKNQYDNTKKEKELIYKNNLSTIIDTLTTVNDTFLKDIYNWFVKNYSNKNTINDEKEV